MQLSVKRHLLVVLPGMCLDSCVFHKSCLFPNYMLFKSTCNGLGMSLSLITYLHWVQAIDTRPPVNATLQVTGAVGWRREGLVYKKNEVKALPRFLFFLRIFHNYSDS